jgi:hypothetical protein
MNTGIKSLIILAFLLFSVPELISGQESGTSAPLPVIGPKRDTFALFADQSCLDVTLSFDLSAYLRKNLDDESLNGSFIIHLPGSDSLVKDIKIKTRGKFRLQYCSFPPMELNFKSFLPAYHFLGNIKKAKLVTHCDPGDGSDDYLLREYLVYKMYNILTDTSYRVRLLRIKYRDSSGKRKAFIQYGFIIEPENVLALRLNTFSLNKATLTQRYIIPNVIDRMAIFNYMIGNYDWAVPNQHNVTILKTIDVSASQMGVAVPYDFDYTGFVNPYYAKPVEETGITDIRERIFTGICRNREVFRMRIEELRKYKDEFYKMIAEFPYLSQRSRRDLRIYLDDFFVNFESENGINRLIDNLLSGCKKL